VMTITAATRPARAMSVICHQVRFMSRVSGVAGVGALERRGRRRGEKRGRRRR
jgi:hypothetical protein